MKTMKKILALVLVIALTAAAAVNITLAYLQDQDEAVNVMTLGNVYIKQNEQQRVEENGEFTDKLEDFEQGKILMPVTYPGDRDADTVTVGGYEITLSDNEANYVDKIVSVTNTGTQDAYIRTLVAVPTGGAAWEPTPVKASDCWLHWNLPTEYGTYWTLNGTPVLIEIDGEGYYVWEFTHNTAVSPEKTTYPMIRGFYMDPRVSNDDNGYYMGDKRIDDISFDDTVDVYVLSQAIQTAGFPDATTALDTGFGDVTKDNAEAWFGNVSVDDTDSNYTEVAVTPADMESIDFNQDNARFVLSGDFTDDVTFDIPAGLNQIYDGSAANFTGANTVTINAPGVAHSYSTLNEERQGNVTVTGFEVQTLNVLAYNNESVTISDNEVNSMSVIGGNFELSIDGNQVDGNFGKYTDGENQTNDYGISLRICDYELSMTNNTITDTYSHAIGINGRQGEVASDWGAAGANNQITEFSGNSITLNTTQKTERGALKIWCDQVYAPYATSGQQPTEAAKALMAEILADTTNVFTIVDGHTVFNIFDYKTNDGN